MNFRAQRVEIDPESGLLELEGNVVLRAHRFRITSRERLTLSRSPRGLHVNGAGRIGLCACKDPPIAFGFSAADLAPPTDVLLEDATLRVASVPIFYSPYFWLRSPDRAGLVPPSLAYRGEEGIVAGLGLHVPLSNDGGLSSVSSSGFGYSEGGGRARLALALPEGRVAFAVDHLERTGLDFQSHIGWLSESGNSTALRADWLAGERARTALSRVDRVALPINRLRFAVGRAERGVVGFALLSDGPRAGELDRVGRVGPGFVLARGFALAPGAQAYAAVESFTAHTESGARFQALAEAGASVSIALSPAILELRARELAELVSHPGASAQEVSNQLGARLGFPLARRFDTLVHSIEPLMEGTLSSTLRQEANAERLLSNEPVPQSSIGLVLGVETGLGKRGGRRAADLRVTGGLSGEASDPERVASARLRADAAPVRVHAEAHGLPESESVELTLRSEIAASSRLRVGAHADARVGEAALPAGVWDDAAGVRRLSPLDRNGWSAGGQLGVPWGLGLETELRSDFDIASGRWLSAAGALGYRHPCRCLSMVLMGARRVGRRSFDAELAIELVP